MKIRSIVLMLLALVAAMIFLAWPADKMVPASVFDVEVQNSRWIESDKFLAYRAIRKTDFDLLVIPVQSGENSFDPIGRSLITRLIADRMITGANLSVPNPTYVFRVLGSHRSTYSKDDIEQLVERVAPRQIVELHANHNRSGQFDLVVTVIDGPSRTMQRSKTWSDLEFGDATPPSVVVKAILDEIVEFVTNKKLRVITPQQTLPLDDFRFTMSLDELIAESARSSLHSAAYLQLLGMLHPHGDFNEARYGLFERSLVQLGRLPDDYPGKRLFAARAYAYLGRRPAAIEALGEPQTMHERALLAILNGDLPALRQEVEKMSTSALDFMAWRELAWLEWSYDDAIERDTIERFVEDAPVWSRFIHRALRDTSIRPEFWPASIKLGLEQLLPNDVTTLQLIAVKAAVTKDIPSELELTRLVWRHLDAVKIEMVAARAGKPENYLSVSELDIIDLSKAVAVANQLLRVEHDLSTKDLPESALSKIAEFDPLFSGHPAVALQKARALDGLTGNASGAELQTLRDQSASEFLQGLAWTGQMTKDAADAARRYDASIRQLRLGKYSVRGESIRIVPQDPVRYYEWPMGLAWFYTMRSDQATDEVLQRCVNYTWTWFSCLNAQFEQLEENSAAISPAGQALLDRHAHRFIGNPQRMQFEIELARREGNEDAEIRELRAQIDGGSTDWSAYYSLGRALTRRGDFEVAQKVFLSYPGFLNPLPDNALANSNHASNAGSLFYWIGRYEEAIPLYEISASSGTGSGNSMSAGTRLSLIVGDLEAAESWTAARIRRYGSKYAIRDLQQILHIRGQSDVAWSIFDQASQSSRRQEVQYWSGAIVGHRMASASIEDIANWVDASDVRKSAFVRTGGIHKNVKLAPRYLLLAGTMDRLPSPELAETMARFRFDRPPRYIQSNDWDRSGPEPVAKPRAYVQEGGQLLEHDELIPTPPGLPDKKLHDPIEPRYEMVANAMTAFLRDDCDKAFELFNETARYYYLDGYLPYFAFCASVVDRADHLAAALEAREPALKLIKREESFTDSELGYRFDEDLTYAVLASFAGRHDEAINLLKQAMNNRPYLEYRTIFPYYQVVDLADRLFERTGVAAYREYALDMARRHTVILPMYSWAYFVVAKYSEAAAEQLEATASGLKLDPRSHRATQLPKSLIQKAETHLTDYGAPYLRRTAAQLNIGT